MLEKLMIGLLSHPWMPTALGRGFLALGFLMALQGLRVARIDRRIARIFDRVGLEEPDVMSAWPWWLRLLTPETTGDWIVVAVVLICGFNLALLGKWARKYQT
ncbi:MAG: hypothetical protein PSV40_02080 [Polaromonas sp.]|uniref:hypothetical protein n=1 Tax=Polaromonas sp. TaxID=1869339 RepID=UPI002489B499|nr:hypothetical protein [Polaromonas sp.]MDI1267877.1 hypothetical protein [Polaromonas sp.]